MEIKNKTLYDKDLIVNYNKYYLNNYIKKNFVVISLISAVFIAYMLIKQEWLYALLLFGILVFYLAMTYVMQILTTKRLLKKSPLVEQPVLQTYLFTEEKIIVQNIKTYETPYDQLTKFKKAPTFFLLQTTDRKSFIVTFDGFESDAEKDKFEPFILEKMGKNKKR